MLRAGQKTRCPSCNEQVDQADLRPVLALRQASEAIIILRGLLIPLLRRQPQQQLLPPQQQQQQAATHRLHHPPRNRSTGTPAAAAANKSAAAFGLPEGGDSSLRLGKRLRNGRQPSISTNQAVALGNKVARRSSATAVVDANDSEELSDELEEGADDDWLPKGEQPADATRKQEERHGDDAGLVDTDISSGSSSSDGGSSSSLEIAERRSKPRSTAAAAADGRIGRKQRQVVQADQLQQQQQGDGSYLQQQQAEEGEGHQDDDCFIVEEPRSKRAKGGSTHGELSRATTAQPKHDIYQVT